MTLIERCVPENVESAVDAIYEESKVIDNIGLDNSGVENTDHSKIPFSQSNQSNSVSITLDELENMLHSQDENVEIQEKENAITASVKQSNLTILEKVDTLNKLATKTEDVTNTRGTVFEDFFLQHKLLLGIHEMKYEKTSPIQEETIPLILSGCNILCRAKNGTGKTAAYVIPILEKINVHKPDIQALILVPTRELALQTSNFIKKIGHFMDIQCLMTTGGTSLSDDILRLFSRVNIIVATPGRILDLCEKRVADLSNCRMVVLDEADKLLSNEFLINCENLLKYHICYPNLKNCQLMLFSATFPISVNDFCVKYLPDTHKINLMDELTLKGVTSYYVYLKENQKLDCLNSLFNKLWINKVIIFCNSIDRVELLAKKVVDFGLSCFYIHARMKQVNRNRVYHNFKNGDCRCLVCSDLFTRGIDIENVNVIINFDFPSNTETYLHRIGRSGRFGRLGLAVNFVTDYDRMNMFKIEKELGTRIEHMPENIDTNLYS